MGARCLYARRMRSSNHRTARRVVFAAPTLLLVLAACGSDTATQSTTSIAITATDFVTIPPVVTEPPGPTTIPERLDVEQTYTVQSGDFPLGVANRFGITLDELVSYNGWADVSKDFPYPGTDIKIPPGSKNQGVVSDGGTGNVTDPGLLTVPPVPTIAGGQDNSGEGTYVIQSGDYPLGIAKKFDVTVDELAAANGWVDLQKDFPFPGTVIKIPPKSG
jgi:LysM repeat protein